MHVGFMWAAATLLLPTLKLQGRLCKLAAAQPQAVPVPFLPAQPLARAPPLPGRRPAPRAGAPRRAGAGSTRAGAGRSTGRAARGARSRPGFWCRQTAEHAPPATPGAAEERQAGASNLSWPARLQPSRALALKRDSRGGKARVADLWNASPLVPQQSLPASRTTVRPAAHRWHSP